LDKEWRVAVKRSEGGLFSTVANEKFRQGDVLEVMPPLGHFYTDVDPSQKKSYVAFAAGSGITPVFSLVKHVLFHYPRVKILLVNQNHSEKDSIFRDELLELRQKFGERFFLQELLDYLIDHKKNNLTNNNFFVIFNIRFKK
jgi:ring-1,2-phenylacetyl-CoA epoxidase subunit PaaE